MILAFGDRRPQIDPSAYVCDAAVVVGDVRLGQAFQADVVNAFATSVNYRRGALFVIYDEWGGFFDHVTPPTAPPGTPGEYVSVDLGGVAESAGIRGPIGLGFRVPAVVCSPRPRGRAAALGTSARRLKRKPDLRGAKCSRSLPVMESDDGCTKSRRSGTPVGKVQVPQ